MDVDLDGFEVAMAQDELSNAQVAGVPDQLGGHRVAEGVGGDAGGDLSAFALGEFELLGQLVADDMNLTSHGDLGFGQEGGNSGLHR